MAMEKRGVIERGTTPDFDKDGDGVDCVKRASDHGTSALKASKSNHQEAKEVASSPSLSDNQAITPL